MKQVWLQQNRNDRVLCFFHGWSMDETTLAHLSLPADWDILLCFDYRDCNWNTALDSYRERHLVAWSLGVWAAAYCAPANWDRAIAVNGTLQPVSSEYGLDPEVFDGTAANWTDAAARRSFYRRVGGRGLPLRSPEEQQAELLALRQAIASQPVNNIYQTALVAGRDRIFPAARQHAAWALHPEVVVRDLEGAHDLWSGLTTWSEVANLG